MNVVLIFSYQHWENRKEAYSRKISIYSFKLFIFSRIIPKTLKKNTQFRNVIVLQVHFTLGTAWITSCNILLSLNSQLGVNTIWLTRVGIVLRRARHDGWHALTTIRWRVNITWTGATSLLYIQAVVVLTSKKRDDLGVKKGQGATGIQMAKWQAKITRVHLFKLVLSALTGRMLTWE